MKEETKAYFKKLASLPRRHASHNHSHDKEAKEAGIVDDFLDPKNHKGQHIFQSFIISKKDPPDAILFDYQKENTLLEITELVNKDAIIAQIAHTKENTKASAKKYSLECERWADVKYFEHKLNELISTKDKKCADLFDTGKEVQLLIHTDEPYLETYYNEHFSSDLTIVKSRFSRIWLLLSYSSELQYSLLLEVKLNGSRLYEKNIFDGQVLLSPSFR